jgi:outer membrane biosynthesis protein TonB
MTRHPVVLNRLLLVILTAAAPALAADGPAAAAAVREIGVLPATGSIRSGAQGPRLVRAGALSYPEIAKQNYATGVVRVKVRVDKDGKVVEAHAVSGPQVLRGYAESAIRYWRYAPAAIDKRAVEATTFANLNFHL